MKQLNVLAVIGFVIMSLHACSQAKHVVQTNAFYVVRHPGILHAAEDSQKEDRSDTTNLLFVETKNADIVWEEAIFDGRVYEIIGEKLNGDTIFIGTEKASRQKIELKASNKNSLWRLTFREKPSSQSAILNNQIIIKGRSGTTAFSIPVKDRKQILLPDLTQ